MDVGLGSGAGTREDRLAERRRMREEAKACFEGVQERGGTVPVGLDVAVDDDMGYGEEEEGEVTMRSDES